MNQQDFLAHAVKLESEAEAIYRRSVATVDAAGNPAAAAFLAEMAGYSAMHRDSVMRRAGWTDLAQLPATGYRWGTAAAPETLAPLPPGHIELDKLMSMALDAERRAATFYAEIADTSADSEVRRLAGDFAAEERRHVLALERFLGLKPY